MASLKRGLVGSLCYSCTMLSHLKDPHQNVAPYWFLAVALWLLTNIFNNALMGWFDEQLGITDVVVQKTLFYAWQYGMPSVLALFGGWLLIQPRLNARKSDESISMETIANSSARPVVDLTPYPDWTIRERFFYLRPDLVENHEKQLWEHVGSEVKDQLSIGRLRIRGRIVNHAIRTRSPLTEIDKSYWARAVFSYWFLREGQEDNNHTYTPREYSKQPEYYDLRVNKEQALRIWPEPLCNDSFMSMTEAATIVYEEARKAGSIWSYAAERLGGRGLNLESSSNEILNYMAQFISGEVQLYGCRPPSRLMRRPIAAERLHGTFENNATEYRFLLGKSPTYSDLKIKRTDMDVLIEHVRKTE